MAEGKKSIWKAIGWGAAGLVAVAVVGVAVAIAVDEHRRKERALAQQVAYSIEQSHRNTLKQEAARCFAERASREGKEALVMAYWGPPRPGWVPSYSFRDVPPGENPVRAIEVSSALRKICNPPADVPVSELLALMSEFDAETKALEAKAFQLKAQQEERVAAERKAAEAERLKQLSWALKEAPANPASGGESQAPTR